jgi:hypothetical protein
VGALDFAAELRRVGLDVDVADYCVDRAPVEPLGAFSADVGLNDFYAERSLVTGMATENVSSITGRIDLWRIKGSSMECPPRHYEELWLYSADVGLVNHGYRPPHHSRGIPHHSRVIRGATMKHLRLVLALFVALTSSLIPFDAKANPGLVIAFSGRCTTTNPVGYPLLGISKGMTIGFSCAFPDGVGGNYFNSVTGSTSASLSGVLHNAGGVGPWCGLVSGEAQANDGGGTVDLFFDVAGSVLSLQGEALISGVPYGVSGTAHVVPDVTTGASCTTGAFAFLVSGEMTGSANIGGCKETRKMQPKKGSFAAGCSYLPTPNPGGGPLVGGYVATCEGLPVDAGCTIQITQLFGGGVTMIDPDGPGGVDPPPNPHKFDKPGRDAWNYTTANFNRVSCLLVKSDKGATFGRLTIRCGN